MTKGRRPVLALDGMGGDHAPRVAARAAARAVSEHGLELRLVGDPTRLGEELAVVGAGDAVAVVPAAEQVDMEEEPALALRAKPQASIRIAAGLLAAGRADALVSAGSTGATLAAVVLELGRLPGIRRPVIAAVLPVPSPGGRGVVLVDAGGGADPPPAALAAAARMGAAYARLLGAADPRIGLLNVGAEAGKGSALARAAYAELAGEPAFVGNVEPAGVLAGAVDVVATDGFTGNIVLKTLEAAAPRQGGTGPGAALLLGAPEEVLIAHGAADEDELLAALCTAAEIAEAGLAERIAALLEAPVEGAAR